MTVIRVVMKGKSKERGSITTVAKKEESLRKNKGPVGKRGMMKI